MSSPSPSGNHSNLTEGQSEDVGGGPMKCVVCGDFFERKDLEGHISSDHLDYYPYSCGHCGHFMPTEELVIFHAERKSHLPIKIRENLNKSKETQLQEIVKKCFSPTAENQDDKFADQISKQKNEITSTLHSPSSGSTYSENLFAAFAPEKFQEHAVLTTSSENSNDMPLIHTESAVAAVMTAVPNMDLVGKMPSSNKPVKNPDVKVERISSPGASFQPAINHECKPALLEQNEEIVQNQAVSQIMMVSHEQHPGTNRVDVTKPEDGSAAPLAITETAKGSVELTAHPPQQSPSGEIVQHTLPSANSNIFFSHSGLESPVASRVPAPSYCSPIQPVEEEAITPLPVVANYMSPQHCSSSPLPLHQQMMSGPPAHSTPLSNSMAIPHGAGSVPVAVSHPMVIPHCSSVTLNHNGKQKRGIEQIANQLAAVSQPVQKQPCMEPLQLFNKKPDIHSEKPKAPIAPNWQRSHCQMCQQFVPVSEICNHIEKHITTRPMYGCLYCNFKGKTPNSVRVHITWKHAHCCARAGAGVKDISDIGGTEADMLSLCFPSFSQSQYEEIKLAHPPTVSTSSSEQPLHSQFISSSKYTTTSGGQVYTSSSNHHYSNGSGSQARRSCPSSNGVTVPVGSTVTRTATMPSGRVYRYMTCTVCGAEVIDALASSHIYQVHINRRDAIQCGYCEYGVPYAVAEVKRHVQAKHPYQPQKIIDRRPEMQEEYMAWRMQCFPDIGSRQPSKPMGYSYESSPTLVKPNQPAYGEKDNALVEILKRPPILIDTKKFSNDSRQQYWSQAHIKNSKKTKCAKCWEEITHLWANRHIWRHLEEEHMSRYKCKAPGCEYQTYLMRSLDTHCNYHGKGLTAEMVGFEDQADQLRGPWVKCWKECFGDEEVPSQVSSSASPDFFSPVDNHGENQMENDFCDSPTSSDNGGDTARNLLFVAAQGQNQVNSTIELTKSQSRDLMFSQISACGTTLTSQGIRLPVIRSVLADKFVLPSETWCQKCCCTVAGGEIDDHIWFAHLGGVLPYRCGRCQRSFVSEQLVRDHWELEHYVSPSVAMSGGMEITKNLHARILFEREMLECFPDVASQMAAFANGKNEPNDLLAY